MIAHREMRQTKLAGNLLVGQAAKQVAQDFLLAMGQCRRRAGMIVRRMMASGRVREADNLGAGQGGFNSRDGVGIAIARRCDQDDGPIVAIERNDARVLIETE